MGVVWSSPYRWQLLAVCFGLFVLTTGLVFLLLSIGLEDDLWRLMGGICASMGSALAVTGTCWCVWVVRHGRYGDSLAINVPDCEAETLTGDVTHWHDNMAADHHHKGGFYDEDDMETEDDAEYDDDDDEEDDEEEEEEEEDEMEDEEEECETEAVAVADKHQAEAEEGVRGHEGKVIRSHDQSEESERTLAKQGAQERLIAV